MLDLAFYVTGVSAIEEEYKRNWKEEKKKRKINILQSGYEGRGRGLV